jgi:hypothetical protein
MGRERTGFYGIDRLENWRIPSATYIRQEIPPVALGTMLDNGLKVLDFVAEQYLIIGGFDMPNDLGGRSDITYAYYLASTEPDTTRLVIRMRTFTEGFAGWLYNRAFEVLDVWMMQARLKGIRERAERMVHPIEYETIPLAELAPTGPIASSENRS